MHREIFSIIKRQLKYYLSIDRDKIQDTEAIENIIISTEFRGTSLWVLICSVFIASLGLNMNSTAVIIGAMLISPLMGPIMGIGLGFGIDDGGLIRRCVKNLAVATVFALVTSSIYFYISPINDARSELLARTQPSLYDVLIAFFGGLAGIITTCSRNKGNILAGVAIATALMPPLCTAGYGLATLQWRFIFGAFYLFIINCVYIGFATYLGVLLFKLRKVGELKHKNFKTWTTVVLIIIMIPSIFTTIGLVRNDIREARISEFVHEQFGNLPATELAAYRYEKSDSIESIEVSLIGRPLSDNEIELIRAKMGGYQLKNKVLHVVQNGVVESYEKSIQKQSVIVDGVIRTLQEQMLQLQRENDSLRHVITDIERAAKDSVTSSRMQESAGVSQ